MTPSEIKKYIVMVGDGGSGCLFQPMAPSNKNFTYILTAKHLFENPLAEDENGNLNPFKTKKGTAIDIRRYVFEDGWKEQSIPFKFIKGTSYFAHPTADAAILKIDYIENFSCIRAAEDGQDPTGYYLHGYPANLRENEPGNKDNSYKISDTLTPANNCSRAQLTIGFLNHPDIEGMSGGPILKTAGDMISIAGIQSAVTHATYARGQVLYVPMKYYHEIIQNNNSKLAKLVPPWIGRFDSLRNETFTLAEGLPGQDVLNNLRITLRNKASKIIQSGITPQSIKEKFEKRLLINECDQDCLYQKGMWVSWLEFLSLYEIVKSTDITDEMLPEVFNSHRLKYLNSENWNNINLCDELMKSDYRGLRKGSTVFWGSSLPPLSLPYIPAGKLIDISAPVDYDMIKVDENIHPLAAFTFVHLDYLKRYHILDKAYQYKNLTTEQLVDTLIEEYHGYFNG